MDVFDTRLRALYAAVAGSRKGEETAGVDAARRSAPPLLLALRNGLFEPGAGHPRFGSNATHPIRERRYAAKILADMLFGDQVHRNLLALGIRDSGPKQALRSKTAFRMMTQRSMSKVRDDDL